MRVADVRGASDGAGVSRQAVAVEVDFGRLRQEIRWHLEAQDGEHAVERVAVDAHTTERTVRRILAGESCSAELAGRLLDAIGYRDGPRRSPETGRLLPVVIRSRYPVDGRRRQPGEKGRIKKVDFANARLTEKQLRAVHRLHLEGGLSLREICRRGWQAWGYASPHAALNSVSNRLRSVGLAVRSQSEATAAANRLRGDRLPGEDRNAARRRRRAVLRATDPAFRAAELERLAALHSRR